MSDKDVTEATVKTSLAVIDTIKALPYDIVPVAPIRPKFSPSTVAINVCTLTGKTVPTVVKGSTYMTELTSVIECKEGIPQDQQRLVFKGKQVFNGDDPEGPDYTVADAGMVEGSKVHLILLLRGS